MARRLLDAYPTTHAGAITGLLERAPSSICGTVLECCSGQHHIARVLRESTHEQVDPRGALATVPRFARVWTNDVVPSLEADFHEDARDARIWREVFPEVDWVITNPPFAGGLPILKQARLHARKGVAFYLRLTFWEPTVKDRDVDQRRGQFLQDFPPNGFMPMSRISHTEDGGTDSTTCAWFVWENHHVEGTPYQWHRVLILSDGDEPPAAALPLDAHP